MFLKNKQLINRIIKRSGSTVINDYFLSLDFVGLVNVTGQKWHSDDIDRVKIENFETENWNFVSESSLVGLEKGWKSVERSLAATSIRKYWKNKRKTGVFALVNIEGGGI